MPDSKYFGIPFATSGDRATIPEATQPGGAVSFTQGFGPDYERNPASDPLAKRVPRDETNEYLFQITNSIKLLQLWGIPEWYATDDAGAAVSYPLYARVRYSGNGWVSLVTNNTATPGADGTKWALFNPTPPADSDVTVKGWQAAPPGSPALGDRYIVAASPTGAWAGQAQRIATWFGTWNFTTPAAGLQVQYYASRHIVLRYTGTVWEEDPSVLGSGLFDRAIIARQATPPGSPALGNSYIVAASPTGAWAGQADKIAVWTGAAWLFVTPVTGLQANSFDGTAYTAWFYTGSAWVASGIITGTITATVPGTYATLTEAFATLSRFRIVDGGSVTVQLAAQVYSVPSAIFMNHPDGHRITVQGTMSGTTPAATDFTITGSASAARASDNAANLTMLRARYGTRITLGATNSGFVVDNASPSPLLKDILIEGQGGANQSGIAVQSGGAIKLDNVAVHNCEHGYFANLRGFISATRGSITGSTQSGIRALTGSTVSLDGTFTYSNAVNGAWVQHGSTLSAIGLSRNIQIRGNGANGLSVQNATANAQSAVVQTNATQDIIAYAMAAIDISGGSVTVNTTSPAVNTVGNSNSYISA